LVYDWEIEIPPLTGGRKRKAYIYLPDGYDGVEDRYPVMYMFDGHNVFFDSDATYGKSWQKLGACGVSRRYAHTAYRCRGGVQPRRQLPAVGVFSARFYDARRENPRQG